ncbi:unnamed protein product [Coffea canephora]|uniref:BUB1 N-terminal domain-containing protein n=1 Tax=Coffea canephora TaxID=49390 RepID=A0A068UEP8_COFCA|nr:unnamed protein product [Coffea canephora]
MKIRALSLRETLDLETNARRYSNDLRYLRVWLQLAYALYFEKMKKFEAAEKMYHLGVQK